MINGITAKMLEPYLGEQYQILRLKHDKHCDVIKFDLFKGLPETLLEKIAAMSNEASVAKGDLIFRKGEKADKVTFPDERQYCLARETDIQTTARYGFICEQAL
jgi:hypothetical protein